jgi:cytochrome P450
MVSIWIGPRLVVQLNHPDLIEQVLVTANRSLKKNFFALRHLHPVLGNGLITSEGDFWLRQRRLAQPAFHRDCIAAYGASMVAYAERMLANWRDGETRDVHADMMRLTLEIAAKTLFDADVGGVAQEVGAAFTVVQDVFNSRFESLMPLPVWIPTPGNVRLRQSVRHLDHIIYNIIQQRRASGDDRGDLLSRMLHARDEDGSQMTDRQLRDETMTLFLAGHETTAIALSWTWFLLAQHPDVEAKLADELRAVLGGRMPTVTDLPRLRYAEMVVLESMRLYPPAYAVGRETVEGFELGGYRLPAGTALLTVQWVVHRDPRYYVEPDVFNPDRWADGLAKRLPRYAYFPFSGGPRVCMGSSFAMMEAVLVLATVAQQYRFTLLPGHPVVPKPSITLRPKHGIKMVLRKR